MVISFFFFFHSLFQLSYDYQWLGHDALGHECTRASGSEPRSLSKNPQRFLCCSYLRWICRFCCRFGLSLWILLPHHFLSLSSLCYHSPQQPKQNRKKKKNRHVCLTIVHTTPNHNPLSAFSGTLQFSAFLFLLFSLGKKPEEDPNPLSDSGQRPGSGLRE